MPYSVPQNIDPNKIFLVNFSELEGRWDPTFAIYNKNINHYAFPIVRLQDLIAKKPQYGTAESGIPRISELAPRYIRITDIDELGNLEDGLGATAENVEMQYILNENDILFARSGATVGKAYLHKNQPYVCFFAGYMIRFVVDNTKILPQYLFIYTQLKPYKDWVRAIQRAAAQPNINAEEYKSLPISLPPLHIQQQIVNVYNAALSQRKKKLSESKAKLASIDQYLLNELGITLPEDSHEKTFIVNYKDVDGGRLDPSIYKKNFKLISSRYENVKLSKHAFINPSTTYKKLTADSKISFVPMEQIDEIYSEISFMEDKKVSESTGYTRFMDGDLLWAKITPCMQNGKSAIARNLRNGYGCGSTEFFVLRPRSNELSIEYLHNILHMQIVRKTAMLHFGGSAGQQRVSSSFLEKFNLPLPPLTKQREIADHISAIRAEAKALEQEANTILEQAKKKVEELILKESD